MPTIARFVITPLTLIALGSIAPVTTALAQAPVVFDAASVKPNTAGGSGASFQIFPGGQFKATNATVRQLVQAAYDFTYERFQIVGGPAWIDVERFDVSASPAADGPAGRVATPQEIAVRIQALLADRFKLTMRRESREMQRFDLVVARPGVLTQNAGTCAPRGPNPRPAEDTRPWCGLAFPPDAGDVQHWVGTGITMDVVARRLQPIVEAIVADKTGLTGAYDLTLDYLRGAPGQSDAGVGVSVFTALQEQLGLRLEATRGQVDVVVIDRVERPTAN